MNRGEENENRWSRHNARATRGRDAVLPALSRRARRWWPVGPRGVCVDGCRRAPGVSLRRGPAHLERRARFDVDPPLPLSALLPPVAFRDAELIHTLLRPAIP